MQKFQVEGVLFVAARATDMGMGEEEQARAGGEGGVGARSDRKRRQELG